MYSVILVLTVDTVVHSNTHRTSMATTWSNMFSTMALIRTSPKLVSFPEQHIVTQVILVSIVIKGRENKVPAQNVKSLLFLIQLTNFVNSFVIREAWIITLEKLKPWSRWIPIGPKRLLRNFDQCVTNYIWSTKYEILFILVIYSWMVSRYRSPLWLVLVGHI